MTRLRRVGGLVAMGAAVLACMAARASIIANGGCEAGTFDRAMDWMSVDNVRFAALVPEPGTMVLAGAGMVGALGLVRRRHNDTCRGSLG